MREDWVISYDISDNRIRRKVVKVLETYGLRVQYSVFECSLTRSELWEVRRRLVELIDPDSDSVRYYSRCPRCQEGSFADGRYQPKDESDVLVI